MGIGMGMREKRKLFAFYVLRLTRCGVYYIFEWRFSMIASYKCKETMRLKAEGSSRKFKAIEQIALRKLDMLEAVVNLETLRIPPSNHFEALHGDREGQYSIRINSQWRICFTWHDGNVYDVEIVDYH